MNRRQFIKSLLPNWKVVLIIGVIVWVYLYKPFSDGSSFTLNYSALFSLLLELIKLTILLIGLAITVTFLANEVLKLLPISLKNFIEKNRKSSLNFLVFLVYASLLCYEYFIKKKHVYFIVFTGLLFFLEYLFSYRRKEETIVAKNN